MRFVQSACAPLLFGGSWVPFYAGFTKFHLVLGEFHQISPNFGGFHQISPNLGGDPGETLAHWRSPKTYIYIRFGRPPVCQRLFHTRIHQIEVKLTNFHLISGEFH